MDKDKLKEIMLFQQTRNITGLYKKFFEILDDLNQSHPITKDEYNRIRKKILDSGNDAIRTLTIAFDSIDISLK